MMFVRLAMPEDMAAVVSMGGANVAETCPGEAFDPTIAERTFYAYLETANPTFFVCEQNRKVIGFLQAHIWGYDYRAGLFTAQKVLYVLPENRGTRAAVLLMKHFIRWSQQLGADRIMGGNDNSFRSERTAGFLEHFGFERVGFAMRKDLGENGDGTFRR